MAQARRETVRVGLAHLVLCCDEAFFFRSPDAWESFSTRGLASFGFDAGARAMTTFYVIPSCRQGLFWLLSKFSCNLCNSCNAADAGEKNKELFLPPGR